MSLFKDDKNQEVDIPDFVEDTSLTDDSIDISIFNMDDDELYDDEPSKEVKSPKNKNKSTIILCLILIAILIVTSVVSLIYAVKQHNAYIAANDQLTQIKNKMADYDKQIQEKDTLIVNLNNKIADLEKQNVVVDKNSKYPKGTKLYITEDGGNQGVRKTASVEAETVTKSDGYPYVLYWGDSVVLIDDATIDANGNYWGKIEGGYIRITYDNETWASTSEQ